MHLYYSETKLKHINNFKTSINVLQQQKKNMSGQRRGRNCFLMCSSRHLLILTLCFVLWCQKINESF